MQAKFRNMEDAQRIAELETEVSEYKLKVSNNVILFNVYNRCYNNKYWFDLLAEGCPLKE